MPALDHSVTVELPPIEAVDQQTGKPALPRTYRIAGNGPGVRAQFVKELKARAWRELDRQASTLPIVRYNRLEASLFQNMAAGKYEWDDEVSLSIDGTKTWYLLMLVARIRVGNNNENIHHSVADEILEKIGFQRLTALMNQADGPIDPNAQSPEATGGESS